MMVGSYVVEDRLFAEYLVTITDSAVPEPIPKSTGNRVAVEYRQKSQEKKMMQPSARESANSKVASRLVLVIRDRQI
jgi:hypothetical protein